MDKLSSEKKFRLDKYFLQWEWGLVLLFIIITVINSLISPHYLDISKLVTITRSFLDKAFIVLPMCMVLMLGEIDISVGSTLALSSALMALSYQRWGIPMVFAMLICIIAGTCCGALNGFILTKLPELPPMIVTFFGMLLYRGCAELLLKGVAFSAYPEWLRFFGWDDFLGVPIILWAFAVFVVIFYLLIHRSIFGRSVYAIGSNRIAAKYSGINVQRVRFTVYLLTGLMAAVAAIFLTSRTTSTRSDIAEGYELDVIAMVILGGVSSAGGKGKLIGAVIAVFIIGYLRYGLGLANMESEYLVAIIGSLLVISALIPNLIFEKSRGKNKITTESHKKVKLCTKSGE